MFLFVCFIWLFYGIADWFCYKPIPNLYGSSMLSFELGLAVCLESRKGSTKAHLSYDSKQGFVNIDFFMYSTIPLTFEKRLVLFLN